MSFICPMCEGNDEQGCYADCPSQEVPRFRAEVARFQAEIAQLKNAVAELQGIVNDDVEEDARLRALNAELLALVKRYRDHGSEPECPKCGPDLKCPGPCDCGKTDHMIRSSDLFWETRAIIAKAEKESTNGQ